MTKDDLILKYQAMWNEGNTKYAMAVLNKHATTDRDEIEGFEAEQAFYSNQKYYAEIFLTDLRNMRCEM